jgi:DNA-binding response OmpR family regulator
METQAGRSILIVDPDPSVRALLVAFARRSGFAAESAEDRESALEWLDAQSWTAFIVEPQMFNGDSVLRDIHTTAGRRNIIIATRPGPSAIAAARRPGVHTVVTKPFRLEELYATLTACCDGN